MEIRWRNNPVDENTVLFPISKDNLMGYIDKTGRIIIKPQFGNIGPFYDGMARIIIGGKYGYIDKTGKIVIQPQFDSAWWFSEGLAVVGNMGKERMDYAYIIDKTGKVVIKADKNMWFAPLGFHEGLATVYDRDDDKQGYINKEGKIVINPQFDGSFGFSEGLCAVNTGSKNKGECGFIDKNGDFVIAQQFDSARGFSEGLAAVQIDDKWGFIDKTGKIVIKPQFDDVNITHGFSEGLAGVKIGDKWGFIDKTGKIVIKPQFEEGMFHSAAFSEGLCVVKIKDQYGYIDKTGKIVIKPQFTMAGHFTEGIADVCLGSSNIFDTDNIKFGYIDKTGKYIWEPTK